MTNRANRPRASQESVNALFEAAKELKHLRQRGGYTSDDLYFGCKAVLDAAMGWHLSARAAGVAAGETKTRPKFTDGPPAPTEPYTDARQYHRALCWWASRYAWDVRAGEAKASAQGLTAVAWFGHE